MVQLVLTNTAANRIICSDRYLPNNLAKLSSRRSPRGSFETKPCMLVNMADELQNASQLFHRFTIPPDSLEAQIPRPGPYLFHSIGVQNPFLQYGQLAVLPHQVPMPHVSPSTTSVPSSESESTSTLNCQNYNILSHPSHLLGH